MRIHFLGICGTFMAGISLIARELGHQVSGMDQNVYPPMSDVLAKQGINLINGYEIVDLPPADIYVVGNVMRRGMPVVEHLLNNKLKYISAPQWLAENVLAERKVIAIAGTHGKTTTTSLLTKMFVQEGIDVGYMIAGDAADFPTPARLGTAKEFILEADEYDSAFFDKRSKFIHYHPDILLINNLEYDHADIFPDLAAIEKQFCHLLRTVPSNGHVVYPAANPAIQRCLAQEKHSYMHEMLGIAQEGGNLAGNTENKNEPLQQGAQHVNSRWQATKQQGAINITSNITSDGNDKQEFSISWNQAGDHNALNLLSATALASISGLSPANIVNGAQSFQGVARRLQSLGRVNGAEVISDFAHHPTAIKAAIAALAETNQQIIAVVDLAANSIRLGVHKENIAAAVADADKVFWFANKPLQWDDDMLRQYGRIYDNSDELAQELHALAHPDNVILLMSNSSFGGLADKLLDI